MPTLFQAQNGVFLGIVPERLSRELLDAMGKATVGVLEYADGWTRGNGSRRINTETALSTGTRS